MISLTEKRKAKGWSMTELARRAKLSPSDISKAEKGRYKLYPSQLKRIAKVLGIPVAEADSLLEDKIPTIS